MSPVMIANNNAYHLIFELLDAHRNEDRASVVECFTKIAEYGASGKASGLMVRLRMGRAEDAETLLEIIAQFAKAVSSEEQQLAVIHVLQVL